MRVYLIGIGGIGMSACAGLAKAMGFEVYGSEEREVLPPASEILKELQIVPSKPDPERLLELKPEVVVLGNAVKKDHIEIITAQKAGLPLLSFPEFLETYLLRDRVSLVVGGTHGKTTTSALLSFTLERLGEDPSFLVGGILKDFGKNYRLGKGRFFVLEGDEYPSSAFNPNPKFFHYRPFGLILTSLEYDHADVYENLEALKSVFTELVKLLPKEGILIFCQDDPNLKEVIAKARPLCKVLSYGEGEKADYRLLEEEDLYEAGEFKNTGKVRDKTGKYFEIHLKIPGKHNLLNALSVLALLEALGFEREEILLAFKDFSGVKRRQEVLYSQEGVVVIDDFAHHPTAVKITLRELQKALKPERTILFFEPRTNSSKRKVFQEDYVEALSLADEIYLKVPPNLERIPEEERIDLEYIKRELEKRTKKTFILEKGIDLKAIENFFNNLKRALIVFMSSAFMEKEIGSILERLKREHGKGAS